MFLNKYQSAIQITGQTDSGRYVFDGIAVPEEYYNPDYSDKKLPLIPDHRRTLYWNPNLKLSKDGKADVRFYNNANHTQVIIQAEGISSDGTILHSK